MAISQPVINKYKCLNRELWCSVSCIRSNMAPLSHIQLLTVRRSRTPKYYWTTYVLFCVVPHNLVPKVLFFTICMLLFVQGGVKLAWHEVISIFLRHCVHGEGKSSYSYVHNIWTSAGAEMSSQFCTSVHVLYRVPALQQHSVSYVVVSFGKTRQLAKLIVWLP